MNILIYSHVALWPIHHAETLEISLKHVIAGDKVTILSCKGALSSCPTNPEHDLQKCYQCRNQTAYSLSKILPNSVEDIELTFNSFNKLDIQFKNLKELGSYRKLNMPMGELVASQLIDDNNDCFFPLENYQEKIQNLISDAENLFFQTREIILEKKIQSYHLLQRML